MDPAGSPASFVAIAPLLDLALIAYHSLHVVRDDGGLGFLDGCVQLGANAFQFCVEINGRERLGAPAWRWRTSIIPGQRRSPWTNGICQGSVMSSCCRLGRIQIVASRDGDKRHGYGKIRGLSVGSHPTGSP